MSDSDDESDTTIPFISYLYFIIIISDNINLAPNSTIIILTSFLFNPFLTNNIFIVY